MKKAKIRIALAVSPSGEWNCSGWGNRWNNATDKEIMDIAADTLEHGEARYWITAEVDIPEPKTIKANIEPAS